METEELAIRAMIRNMTEGEVLQLVEELPTAAAEALLDEFGAVRSARALPESPLEQALAISEAFAVRPHLEYLSERIAQAVSDVEGGRDRRIIIQMPPRSGKTEIATKVAPAWILSTHPSWSVILTSYSSALAESWNREIMEWTQEGLLGEHLKVKKGAATAAQWQTTAGAVSAARSIGAGTTGLGGKVVIIDDPHKDFAEAHSEARREGIWNWLLSVANTRLHPPSLVIVIMTRWHEDDLVGRLLSPEYPGDPAEWEVISLPAIAEEGDALGRAVGDPLYSPLIEETREEALTRWEKVKRSVGSYVWSALFQQRPAPAQGSIFDVSWWRFWTDDPAQVTDDGRVRYLNPVEELTGASWVDSWDLTFKGSAEGDYTVGQRWAMLGADRFLIGQQRDRWGFNEQLAAFQRWAEPGSVGGTGRLVHTRLVEDSANGPALIEALRSKVPGIKPIKARGSKESRAQAVTPEIESGNVYLPHPSMPGYAWVGDYISEFRNFPNDAHDDQVDTTSQALSQLRGVGRGGLSIPGRQPARPAGARGLTLPGQGPGVPLHLGRIEAAKTAGKR